MTQKERLKEEYFHWMVNLVRNDNKRTIPFKYSKLFRFLHSREFTYIIDMDGNRAEDGIQLRYRFGWETGVNDNIIATYLDDSPCTILEMMVALSYRCEEQIMDDPDIGNRTGQWFMVMIRNLGLESMVDEKFNLRVIDEKINTFIDRNYQRNGKGGLFVIDNCREDLRNVEIWYQMCWYLNSIL